MPEGPEIKIMCDNLQYLKNYEIKDIKILSGRYLKSKLDDLDLLVLNLPLKINSINVKGKLLYFILENNWIILNTMGMSGRWTKKYQKHCHIEFSINNFKIWFCDPRRFGTMKILNNIELLENKLNSIGPDLLNSDIKESEFIDIMNKHKNKNICKVLMNQSIISGCGNYIKSESLYRAKISPHNNIIDINKNKLQLLFKSLKQVMLESYKSQGASISTYYNVNEEKGKYSFEFRVYKKKFDPNGNKVISEKTPDGRTSHWVKEIQT